MRRPHPGPRDLSLAAHICAAFLLTLLLGCAGLRTQPGGTESAGGAPPFALLPPFPADPPAGRGASTMQSNTINGADFFAKSGGAVVSGMGLQLPSAPGSIEWGIYMFPAGGATLLKLNADCPMQNGSMAWIGLADFARHAWEFHGPYVSGTDLALDARFISPGGNFFCAVVAFDGTQMMLNSCTVTTDVTVPTYTVSGTVLKDGTTPLGGVQLNLMPGGAMATTDSAGAYSFGGVEAGSYTVTPVQSGFIFTPPDQGVTVTSADVTGIDFSAAGQTYSISGTVLKDGSSALGGVQLTLMPGGATATTDAAGVYSFSDVVPGSYSVTPSLGGYNFTPTSRDVPVSTADVTGIDFSAAAITYSLSGTVLKDGTTALSGVQLTLSPGGATTTTDAAGAYSFSGLAAGSYTVTPSKAGYTFTPASRNETITDADLANIDFSATLVTYTVSGTVLEDGTTPLANVLLTLTPGGRTALTDGSGNYTITAVVPGTYTATPSLSGYDFTPASRSVTVSNANVANIDFSATAQTTVTYTSDIKPILDTNCIACHNANTHRAGVQLQDYTHAKSNASASLADILANVMPPSGPLSAADKALFQAWVDAGEPE